MSAKKIKFERVDGVPYVFGSDKHRAALRAKIERTHTTLRRSPLAERFDSNAVAFLARDLTFVSQDVQRVVYEKLRAAEFCPIKSTVPRGATSWVYRQMEIVGQAKRGAHLSANDAPNADVGYEEFAHRLTHVTASYQYTIDDLEKAAFAGVPLERDKAEACAEIIARDLDDLMRSGDASQGITGLFNNPNVPDIDLDNGEWLTATAAEITADFAEIEQAGIAQSRDHYGFKELVLPTAYEGRLLTLAKADASDLMIGPFLLANSRSIKSIKRWIALDDATGTDVGVANPPMGLALDTAEKDAYYAEIPIPYEELAPEISGFGYVVNARALFGGVVIKKPLAMGYVENLD